MSPAPGTLPTTASAAACTTALTLPALLLMCAMPARAAVDVGTCSSCCCAAAAARAAVSAGVPGGARAGGARLAFLRVELGRVGGGLPLLGRHLLRRAAAAAGREVRQR